MACEWDKKKARERRCGQARCRGCSTSCLTWTLVLTWPLPCLCAEGGHVHSLGFCQPLVHILNNMDRGGQRCDSFWFQNSVVHTLLVPPMLNLSHCSPKVGGKFHRKRSPEFITTGCQKGNTGHWAITLIVTEMQSQSCSRLKHIWITKTAPRSLGCCVSNVGVWPLPCDVHQPSHRTVGGRHLS